MAMYLHLKTYTGPGCCGQLTKADQKITPSAFPLALSLDFFFQGHKMLSTLLHWKLFVVAPKRDCYNCWQRIPKSKDRRVKWSSLAKTPLAFFPLHLGCVHWAASLEPLLSLLLILRVLFCFSNESHLVCFKKSSVLNWMFMSPPKFVFKSLPEMGWFGGSN